MKKSFTEIKTEMRINWAKKALQDENYNTKTIDAIGQLCGYKSKSSFYSAFKEVTNYTPQEFKNQNNT